MAYSTWSGYRYIKRPDKVAAVMTPLLLFSAFLTGYTKLPLIYSFIVVVVAIVALTIGFFWISTRWQDWQRRRKG
jgi:general stress protein CsbA